MPAARLRPRVGDRCWEVEWCYFSFTDENGDGDPDRDKYRFRCFATHEEALACAREVYPTCCYGSVRITHQEFVPYDEDDATCFPHAGFWEALADSEFYEGE